MSQPISLVLPILFLGTSVILVLGMMFLHLKWLDRHNPDRELLVKLLRKLN